MAVGRGLRMFQLYGRVGVVTGGSSGIGAAVCAYLRAEGAIPVSWDVLPTADLQCDVSDPHQVSSCLRSTIERYGAPTILIANAGVGGFGSITDLDVGTWDRAFAVNTRSVFLLLQAISRLMVERGEAGSIVITTSVNGMVADPGTAAYAASKAAAIQLARVAARELGIHGIRVNAIAPGPIDTPMMADTKSIPGYWADIAKHTPLGRIGTPEDIAEAVVGLLKMSWVTGQVLGIDGGSSLATARGVSIGDREHRGTT